MPSCPGCDRSFKSVGGMRTHQTRKGCGHKKEPAPAAATPTRHSPEPPPLKPDTNDLRMTVNLAVSILESHDYQACTVTQRRDALAVLMGRVTSEMAVAGAAL